jgi:hypothetical protein
MRTTQTTIETEFGRLHVDVLHLAEGYVAKVDERHRLPAHPKLSGPLATTVQEAVAQIEEAVADFQDKP